MIDLEQCGASINNPTSSGEYSLFYMYDEIKYPQLHVTVSNQIID